MRQKVNTGYLQQADEGAAAQHSFKFIKSVLLKHTNFMRNAYFSNYVEWQGDTRESFFLAQPQAVAFMKANPHIAMVTHSLGHRFIMDTYYGDQIQIGMTTKDILDYSVILLFKYHHLENQNLIGEGWQKICFRDTLREELCRIPPILVELAKTIHE